ncbi:MAG: toll/interleukin-1 receptor domain-containing protein [Chloroflexota bacterium]
MTTQELHAYLLVQGTDPWLDTKNLLPGQDWKMEIDKALDEIDLILLCLWKTSVTREGYVQKEMRLAMDRALEIPQGEIFLIPARFEEVDLPYGLRDYQWVDLYTESGKKKLLKSLNLRAERVGPSLSYKAK